MSLIRAIHFPTTEDYLLGGTTDPNAQSGVMATIPNVDTNLGFLSYWIKYDAPIIGNGADIATGFTTHPDGSYAGGFNLNSTRLELGATRTIVGGVQQRLLYQAVINNPPNVSDGHWHHYMWHWDTSLDTSTQQSKWWMAIDNVQYETIISGDGVPFSVNLHNFVFHVGTSGISLAELWMNVGANINVGPTIRPKFINASDLTPAYLSCTGAVPFGIEPHIYSWGDAELFPFCFARTPGAQPRVPLVWNANVWDPSQLLWHAQGAPNTATDDPFIAPPPGPIA